MVNRKRLTMSEKKLLRQKKLIDEKLRIARQLKKKTNLKTMLLFDLVKNPVINTAVVAWMANQLAEGSEVPWKLFGLDEKVKLTIFVSNLRKKH